MVPTVKMYYEIAKDALSGKSCALRYPCFLQANKPQQDKEEIVIKEENKKEDIEKEEIKKEEIKKEDIKKEDIKKEFKS